MIGVCRYLRKGSIQYLSGLAAVADHDDDIIGGDDAQAPVQSVGWMQIDGECSRAGQRRRDLLRDIAGFANADQDDLAPTFGQQLDRRIDLRPTRPRRRLLDGLGL